MRNYFSSLPDDAVENLKGLATKMDEIKAEVMRELKIPSGRLVTLDHCWDGSVRVWVDGVCVGFFNPSKTLR